MIRPQARWSVRACRKSGLRHSTWWIPTPTADEAHATPQRMALVTPRVFFGTVGMGLPPGRDDVISASIANEDRPLLEKGPTCGPHWSCEHDVLMLEFDFRSDLGHALHEPAIVLDVAKQAPLR
jgi:hypothetical protein